VSERLSTEIAIIGAGVVGLAIAVRLAGEGQEVTLIEPNEPGSGASYGNPGTIADYAVSPVGAPAVLRNLPTLMFDRDSPLSIRLAALPALTPWLIRFAYQSVPKRAKANAAAIAQLLAEAVQGWQELGAAVGAQDLFRQNGCLYVYDSRAAFAGASWDVGRSAASSWHPSGGAGARSGGGPWRPRLAGALRAGEIWLTKRRRPWPTARSSTERAGRLPTSRTSLPRPLPRARAMRSPASPRTALWSGSRRS
jgi:glycine/D-amino acid oxidase-like deaminating enzyme